MPELVMIVIMAFAAAFIVGHLTGSVQTRRMELPGPKRAAVVPLACRSVPDGYQVYHQEYNGKLLSWRVYNTTGSISGIFDPADWLDLDRGRCSFTPIGRVCRNPIEVCD